MLPKYTIIKTIALVSYPFIVYFLTRKIVFFKKKPAFLYLLMVFPIAVEVIFSRLGIHLKICGF